MRIVSLAALLIIAAAAPATAQRTETVEQRVQRLEKELRAVQRKVFPGGAGMTVEPEIAQPRASADPAGVPASSAVADLSARVDALEAQLRAMTAQSEETAHRLRQLEQAFTQYRSDAEAPPPQAPATPPAAAAEEPGAPAATSASADPGEQAYLAGFRHWEAGRFVEAQTALEEMVKKYPRHERASYAQNLLGRAYLDGGKPATAAKIFLANYQGNPKGDRAQDSLLYLGQALVRLEKRPEACKVYEELQDVYGANMRAPVKRDLPKARQAARCA